MKVEKQNNEILVRIDPGDNELRIQSILDYLRYEELTSKSMAEQKELEALVANAKKGRWEKIKKDIGYNK